MQSAVQELDRLEKEQGAVGGRNAFEGEKTRRVYALSDKSRVFDAFACNEVVGRLNDYFLQEHYRMCNLFSGSRSPLVWSELQVSGLFGG